jgi:thioesterase domain-containing protein
MNDPIRFEFKSADKLAPADREVAAITLSDTLRALHDEAWRLVNLLASERADSAVTRAIVLARAAEIVERSGQAVELAELASQTRRRRGAYAASYADLGGG